MLREQITLNGIPLHVVDTAGLREASDAVEREGVRRARAEIASADRILLVIDDSDPHSGERGSALLADPVTSAANSVPVTIVRNKCDLSGRAPGIGRQGENTEIVLSARTGAGLDLLREHLLECAGFATTGGTDFTARQRHIVALEETAQHLEAAQGQLATSASAELLAEDLRYAQDSLGSITGRYTSDDLLGEIFANFCIGK